MLWFSNINSHVQRFPYILIPLKLFLRSSLRVFLLPFLCSFSGSQCSWDVDAFPGLPMRAQSGDGCFQSDCFRFHDQTGITFTVLTKNKRRRNRLPQWSRYPWNRNYCRHCLLNNSAPKLIIPYVLCSFTMLFKQLLWTLRLVV